MVVRSECGTWSLVPSTAAPVPVLVEGPVTAGGQAAVARARVLGGAGPVAIRVELFDGDCANARRVAMTRAGELSVTQPEKFPALLPVQQTFVTHLPLDLPVHQGAQVICDVAQWCQPLRDSIGRLGAWSAKDAVRAWLPLATTMDRLYREYGWVHRDIDEGNVLVSPDGRLRLADLGIVSIVDPEATHVTTSLIGKHETYPPEARSAFLESLPLSARPSYDAWQLGRLLYMLLTRDSAAVGLSLNGRLVADPVPHWTGWDRITDLKLSDLVLGLVDHDPHSRRRLGPTITCLSAWLRHAPEAGSTTSQFIFAASDADVTEDVSETGTQTHPEPGVQTRAEPKTVPQHRDHLSLREELRSCVGTLLATSGVRGRAKSKFMALDQALTIVPPDETPYMVCTRTLELLDQSLAEMPVDEVPKSLWAIRYQLVQWLTTAPVPGWVPTKEWARATSLLLLMALGGWLLGMSAATLFLGTWPTTGYLCAGAAVLLLALQMWKGIWADGPFRPWASKSGYGANAMTRVAQHALPWVVTIAGAALAAL